MPVIAIVVGAIGSAVGATIAGSLFGAAVGSIGMIVGSAIGAGVAGGLLSVATGGKFGSGFLMGAAGSVFGSFLKGGLGSIFGEGGLNATQFADGTSTAGMLEGQGGAMLDAGGNVIEGMDVASAMGDMSTAGFTDSATGVETFGDMSEMASEGTPLGEANPQSSFMDGYPGNRADAYNLTDPVFDGRAGEQAFTNMLQTDESLAQGWGFENAPSGQNSYSMLPDSPMVSEGMDYAPQGLENVGQGSTAQPASGTTTASMLQSQGGQEFAPNALQPQQSKGLGGMFKSSDAWLKDKLGQSAPSTGKLLMGGGQYLMDQYNISKQERMAKGLAPMSFEQYSAQFSDPNAYKVAANRMAQGGHTGTLPALLARMKNDVRGKYASYLPEARSKYYDVQGGVQANKNASLARLFNGLGYGT